MDDFKYDVALSFLANDESLAEELASSLRDHVEVFIYSERQKELAGTDGLDEFSRVFGQDARICVVLYRHGWGETPWSGVEATAIKDRGMTSGWAFLLVISLDGSAPIWLPKTQLWLHWERFGKPGAIAVIERKITEGSGEIRQVTAADHAARAAAVRRRDSDRDEFLGSDAGVAAGNVLIDDLFAHLESQAAEIGIQAPHLQIRFRRRQDNRVAAVTSPGYTVTFGWTQPWSNSLKHSSLLIREFFGPYSLEDANDPVRVRGQVHATISLDLTGSPAWVMDDEPDRFYSSRSLAERYLKLVVDHACDEPRYEQLAPDDEAADWP